MTIQKIIPETIVEFANNVFLLMEKGILTKDEVRALLGVEKEDKD